MDVHNYPSADKKYVLAYQLRGTSTIESIPIPVGKEDVMDAVITAAPEDKPIKFERANLTLWKDEIKGPMTKAEFEYFRQEMFTTGPTPNFQEWQEMGRALKAGKSMEKWKRKDDKES